MKTLFSFLCAIALVSAPACRTSENYATSQSRDLVEIFYAHDGLASAVSMQNFKRAETNGLLEAQVDLKNHRSTDLPIEHMFEWFDANGFKIESAIEHWTPVTLNGNHIHVVRAIAPKPGANAFRIHVRRPHEVTR